MELSPRFPGWLRALHAGVAVSVAAALVSGQFAGDYKRALHAGFDVHLALGLGAAAFVALRGLLGLAGPAPAAFSSWPGRGLDLRAWAASLARAIARRGALEAPHAGVAGVVQFLMLVAAAVLAATGAAMAFTLEPGIRAAGAVRALKEVHEATQPVLLALLALHVAGALHHALGGRPVLSAMFSPRRR